MARKRFNTAEREIIAGGPGTRVEWQNVTQWHPGRLVSGTILNEPGGWQSARVINLAATGMVDYLQVAYVSPGHIRRPATIAEQET